MLRITLFLLTLLFALSASSQPAGGGYTSSDLEMAWRCQPQLLTLRLSVQGIHFLNSACTAPLMSTEERTRLRAALVSYYGSTTEGARAFESDRVRRVQQKNLDSANAERAEDEARRKAEIDEERAEEQRQAAETRKKEIENTAREERERLLKSGKIKVKSFEDALLFHSPTNDLFYIMASPLLLPDKKVYAGGAVLDAQQENNVLRVTIGGPTGPIYAFLRITDKTVNYAPQDMRLRGGIYVIGKYVGNRKYRTVLGEEKTAPIIEGLYMDKMK